MKYRRLNRAELQELEEEFVEFLILNGIMADDWKKLKNTDLPAAEKMTELFSEVVFESIMKKARYVDYISPKSVLSINCTKKKMLLVKLDVQHGSDIDLTQSDPMQLIDRSAEIAISYSEKSYNEKREYELFKMVQSGATISKGDLYLQLSMAYADRNKQ